MPSQVTPDRLTKSSGPLAVNESHARQLGCVGLIQILIDLQQALIDREGVKVDLYVRPEIIGTCH